jgi:threonine dehydrogenase-like Zn-dependent dehydrogenase
MRATVIHAPHDIRVEEVPDARVREPRDAVVRVVRACICGSDLWAYRGEAARKPGQRIGHEFLGVVEETGAGVTGLRAGDLVVAPFVWSDGSCAYCAEGLTTSCVNGGFWGSIGADGPSDGGQGEAVRVPYADTTLVRLPAEALSDDRLLTGLLALSDVLGTGHHAALGAGVRKGGTVAVVGDGAVGLLGILAAQRLGAARIIAMSRNADRQALAKQFGATDIVEERGDAGVAKIKDLTGGYGAHSTIEAVGTPEAMKQAIGATRAGGHVGFVGVSHGVELDGLELFFSSVHLHGGPAPVRRFLPELIDLIMTDQINPGVVFDLTLPIADAADGYKAMDERRATKVLLTV